MSLHLDSKLVRQAVETFWPAGYPFPPAAPWMGTLLNRQTALARATALADGRIRGFEEGQLLQFLQDEHQTSASTGFGLLIILIGCGDSCIQTSPLEAPYEVDCSCVENTYQHIGFAKEQCKILSGGLDGAEVASFNCSENESGGCDCDLTCSYNGQNIGEANLESLDTKFINDC